MEHITKRPNWDKKKILLLRLDRLGDLIVSTPIMESIKKTFPNAQVDLLGSQMNKALFKHCDYLDNTYCYNKKNIFDSIKLFFFLRAQKYDIIMNFIPHSKSSNFFVKHLGAPIKMAISHPLPKYESVYTHSAPQTQKAHILELYHDNAVQMGFEEPSLKPVIKISQELRTKVNINFPKTKDTMRIIISIGNILRPHKRWKIENYAKLVEYLNNTYNVEKKQLDIIIMVGKNDLPLLKEFKDVPESYYTLYVGTDIAESAALIDFSNLFICTSSGPSHIAASTSCPILSLITQYMYDCWRPLREKDAYIVNEDLHDITIEEVISKVEEYIQSWKDTI